MRSTTFLTTALQVGAFLTAAEAARPRRRQAPGYGANEDSVQWGAWSATTFQTVTTPAYSTWAATTSQAYKPAYHEEGQEEWNNWEEDEYSTTRKSLTIPTPYNPFPTTTTQMYQSWEQAKPYTQTYNSWEQAPSQSMTTQYNSWENAKPSPTSFMYQTWVGTARGYNGDDEEYQGWQETSTMSPQVYQTWSQTVATPTNSYNNWQATSSHMMSYSTKVVTVEEYQTWSQASYSPEVYSTWSEAATTTQAYQTWSQATAIPTKPAEQVQEWGQWQGQQGQQNGHGNGYANGNGKYYSFSSTTTPFINIPTNAANGASGLGGAGAGGLGGAGLGAGLGGALGGAGGLPGLPGLPVRRL